MRVQVSNFELKKISKKKVSWPFLLETAEVVRKLHLFQQPPVRRRAKGHTAGMPKAVRSNLPLGLLLKAQAKQQELVKLL